MDFFFLAQHDSIGDDCTSRPRDSFYFALHGMARRWRWDGFAGFIHFFPSISEKLGGDGYDAGTN